MTKFVKDNNHSYKMVSNVSIFPHVEESTKINSILLLVKDFAKLINKFFGLIGLILLLIVLSPIFIIFAAILLYKVRKINSEVKIYKDDILKKISSFSFKDVHECEQDAKSIYIHTRVTSGMKKVKIPILSAVIRNMDEIHSSFDEIIKVCQARYYTSKSELKVSDEDFSKYHKQFAAFKDIWNDEDDQEEKELLYNDKNKLIQN
jgi:hypothetical protein